MGKDLGEVFCKICGKSSNEDKNFHKKQQLCNRHYLQIKRHGKPTGNDRIRTGDLKNYCEICNDKESIKYYVWNKPGELQGKTLCNKHYTQMLRHNYLLDNIPSEHNKRIMWTEGDKKRLEEYYKAGLSFKEISEKMNRSLGSINAMSIELKLGDKYMRTNNPNFKAIYQDYDWCYDRYINKSMSHQEMADEAGCTLRVIQKWCSEKHGINQWTFKEYKKLNDIQRQIILYSTLGDGHIDKRQDQPMYIESHSEDEKDYIFWKYSILKDICNKEPVYYKEKYNSFGGDKMYLCKPFYRINTRIINDLIPIREMSRLDKIKILNEFGLSLHALDDGNRSNLWEVCLAEWSQEEIDTYIDICRTKFDLECTQSKHDNRYVYFTAISSKKLDEIILRNIPNDLDIIHKKILDNKDIKPLQYCRYIIVNDNEKIGLGRYCKLKHLNYEYSKTIFDNFGKEYVNEEDFLERVD